jgi:hypothetical protein
MGCSPSNSQSQVGDSVPSSQPPLFIGNDAVEPFSPSESGKEDDELPESFQSSEDENVIAQRMAEERNERLRLAQHDSNPKSIPTSTSSSTSTSNIRPSKPTSSHAVQPSQSVDITDALRNIDQDMDDEPVLSSPQGTFQNPNNNGNPWTKPSLQPPSKALFSRDFQLESENAELFVQIARERVASQQKQKEEAMRKERQQWVYVDDEFNDDY